MGLGRVTAPKARGSENLGSSARTWRSSAQLPDVVDNPRTATLASVAIFTPSIIRSWRSRFPTS